MSDIYQLLRILPNGHERTQGPFPTKRDAARAAFYVLLDNGAADKRAASVAAARIEDTETGDSVEAHGYTFRILYWTPAVGSYGAACVLGAAVMSAKILARDLIPGGGHQFPRRAQ